MKRQPFLEWFLRSRSRMAESVHRKFGIHARIYPIQVNIVHLFEFIHML